jgi:hypothetical protein
VIPGGLARQPGERRRTDSHFANHYANHFAILTAGWAETELIHPKQGISPAKQGATRRDLATSACNSQP